MFNFFKTKPAADVFWMTPRAKLIGFCNHIRERLNDARVVLVVAHFRASLSQIGKQLSENGVPNELVVGPLSRKQALRRVDYASRPQALLVLGDSLICEDSPAPFDRAATPIPFLVFERHFVRSKDEAIQSFARTLGRPYELAFHLSLLDPLMLLVRGDLLAAKLVKWGHSESESIKPVVLTGCTRSAQRFVAKRATEDRAADSADDWLRLNMPEMRT